MMLQLKILWRSCDCNTFNINSFIMMIILIAVLGFISCLAAENVNNFESMLANIKLMQANGRYFSYEDMINFAETCISNQISAQDLKLMAPVKHSGRYLADDNSFHCASFKAVNSANATASDLPDCLISNVYLALQFKLVIVVVHVLVINIYVCLNTILILNYCQMMMVCKILKMLI